MDIVKHNQVAWDIQSNKAESPWVKPVSRDEIAGARAGNWQVILTPTKPVPSEWFGNIRGKDLPNSPLANCKMIIAERGKSFVFINSKKLLFLNKRNFKNIIFCDEDNFFQVI